MRGGTGGADGEIGRDLFSVFELDGIGFDTRDPGVFDDGDVEFFQFAQQLVARAGGSVGKGVRPINQRDRGGAAGLL